MTEIIQTELPIKLLTTASMARLKKAMSDIADQDREPKIEGEAEGYALFELSTNTNTVTVETTVGVDKTNCKGCQTDTTVESSQKL